MNSQKQNLLQLLHSTDPSNHLIAYQILKGNKDLQKELCNKEFISSLINSSQEAQIKIALLLIKKDAALHDWAKMRYAPLLDFLDIKTLDRLFTVPRKLLWVNKISRVGIQLQDWMLSDTFAEHLVKTRIFMADFRSKSMKKLPDFLFKIPSLERLLIAEAKLKELPDCWEKLPNLNCVFILKNQLKTLPKSFGKLKKMQYLVLRNNHFAELPKVIQNFKKLTILGLDRNRKMTSLPEWLGNFKKLTNLSLSDLKINSFPSSFVHLTKLAELRLHNTPIAQKYNFTHSADSELIKDFIAKIVGD